MSTKTLSLRRPRRVSRLAELRRTVDAAAEKLAAVIHEQVEIQAAADDASRRAYQAKAYAANTLAVLAGPRGAQGWTPPKTAIELEAIEAGKRLADVMKRRQDAQRELDTASAELLSAENPILNRWRDRVAMEIEAMERAYANPAEIAALRAELRSVTPDSHHVRRDQGFTPSDLVKRVLHDSTRNDLNTPVHALNAQYSNAGAVYEKKRAEILAAAEADNSAAA